MPEKMEFLTSELSLQDRPVPTINPELIQELQQLIDKVLAAWQEANQ